jgi:hypothetical protein
MNRMQKVTATFLQQLQFILLKKITTYEIEIDKKEYFKAEGLGPEWMSNVFLYIS